jgi:hypothetical protein
MISEATRRRRELFQNVRTVLGEEATVIPRSDLKRNKNSPPLFEIRAREGTITRPASLSELELYLQGVLNGRKLQNE